MIDTTTMMNPSPNSTGNHDGTTTTGRKLSNADNGSLTTATTASMNSSVQNTPTSSYKSDSDDGGSSSLLSSSGTPISGLTRLQQQGPPDKPKSRWRRMLSSEYDGPAPGAGSGAMCPSGRLSASDNAECFNGILGPPASPHPDQLSSPSSHVNNSPLKPLNHLVNSSQHELGSQREIDKMPQFEQIEENAYLFNKNKRKSKKEARRMICDCVLTKEERNRGLKGCGEDCLNRMLMIECGSRCSVGEQCENKRFQRRQYAKVEPFRTDKKGWGLRAIESIPEGAFIIEYIGEVIEPSEFQRRVKKYHKRNLKHHYFMSLKSNEIIDATSKGNFARFVNHSCEPNCETQKWTVNGELRIGFFALREINRGEEITLDYQYQRYGKKAQECYCETRSCRGFIGGSSEEGAAIHLDGTRITAKQKAKYQAREDEEFLEDLGLEEEIAKLLENGFLRSRQQVLTAARLMARCEDYDDKMKLLDIILNTSESAYLRLLIDYHGLKLLWSWMVDAEDKLLKLKLVLVLQKLPIPDQKQLTDSKVLEVVERWSKSISPPQSEKTSRSASPVPEPSPAASNGSTDDPNIPIKQEPKSEQAPEEISSESKILDENFSQVENTEDAVNTPMDLASHDADTASQSSADSQLVENDQNIRPEITPDQKPEKPSLVDHAIKEESDGKEDIEARKEISESEGQDLNNQESIDDKKSVIVQPEAEGLSQDSSSEKNQTCSEQPEVAKEPSSQDIKDETESKASEGLTLPPLDAEGKIKRKIRSVQPSQPETTNDPPSQSEPNIDIRALCQSLLLAWRKLPEGKFKIPRLIKQKRREDEQEADKKTQEFEAKRAHGLTMTLDGRRPGMTGFVDETQAGQRRKRPGSFIGAPAKRSYQDFNIPYNQGLAPPASSSSFHPIEPEGPKMSKEERRQQFELTTIKQEYEKKLQEKHEEMERLKRLVEQQSIAPGFPPFALPPDLSRPPPPFPLPFAPSIGGPPLNFPLPTHHVVQPLDSATPPLAQDGSYNCTPSGYPPDSNLFTSAEYGDVYTDSTFEQEGLCTAYYPGNMHPNVLDGPEGSAPDECVSSMEHARAYSTEPCDQEAMEEEEWEDIDFEKLEYKCKSNIVELTDNDSSFEENSPKGRVSFAAIAYDSGIASSSMTWKPSDIQNPLYPAPGTYYVCTDGKKYFLSATHDYHGREISPIVIEDKEFSIPLPTENYNIYKEAGTRHQKLPPGWIKATDPSGAVYYYHQFTKRRQWKFPTVVHIPLLTTQEEEEESLKESNDGAKLEDGASSQSSSHPENRDNAEDSSNEDNLPKKAFNALDSVSLILEIARNNKGNPSSGTSSHNIVSNLPHESTNTDAQSFDSSIHSTHAVIEAPALALGDSGPGSSLNDILQKSAASDQSDTSSIHFNHLPNLPLPSAPSLQPTSSTHPPIDPRRRSTGSRKPPLATMAPADTSSSAVRARKASSSRQKIQDHFMAEMSKSVVKYLNPFLNADCKRGRILTDVDFKYLAKKLTNHIMLKELKHLKSPTDLRCTEAVRHKAKDYIKKYMSKFGPVYTPSDKDKDGDNDQAILSPSNRKITASIFSDGDTISKRFSQDTATPEPTGGIDASKDEIDQYHEGLNQADTEATNSPPTETQESASSEVLVDHPQESSAESGENLASES